MDQPIKILVTGANGQVGHELLRALAGGAHDANPHPALRATFSHGEKGNTSNPIPFPPGGQDNLNPSPPGKGVRDCEVIPATRSGECVFPPAPEEHDSLNPSPPERGAGVRVRTCEVLDLADLDGLAQALDRIAPDVIINAAAYTAVDKAEDEPDAAQRINGDALTVMGAWARRHGARVVHYSTDYVFDGSARQPYREDDAPHPVSVYGRTKLAGEQALRDSGARYLVFRTAWVYAARGKNFLRTMLRLGAGRDELRVVDDQVGAPTPARLIADATMQALAQWLDDATPARDGVYHLVASGQVSWCGFARAIFERAHAAGLLPRVPQVAAITTADYPTRATRPAYSVLGTARLRATFGVELPGWQAGLDGVVADLARGS